MEGDVFSEFSNCLEFDLPEGNGPPVEPEPEDEVEPDDPEIFVQKLVTEIWVFTDIKNKNRGTETLQDLLILGDMSRSDLNKIITRRKNQRRRRK